MCEGKTEWLTIFVILFQDATEFAAIRKGANLGAEMLADVRSSLTGSRFPHRNGTTAFS